MITLCFFFFIVSEKLPIQDLPYPHLCEKAIHVDITVSTDTEQTRMRLNSSKLNFVYFYQQLYLTY